jgi:hypothetical protein
MTGQATLDADDLGVYDHVRTTGDTPDPGVYRVVGTAEDSVTLLRVTDADGTRRHTGTVVTVARANLSALEPAENPDGNRSVGTMIAGRLDGVYWSFRVLAGTVRERPIPGAVALAAMAVGLVGDRLVSIPEPGATVLFLGGALGLVLLSRR